MHLHLAVVSIFATWMIVGPFVGGISYALNN